MNSLLIVLDIILLLASIIDYRTKTIPLSIQCIILVISILIMINYHAYYRLLIAFILLIISVLIFSRSKIIGGADIKIILMLYLVFGNAIGIILLFASITGISNIILTNQKVIAFMPHLLVGVIICQILNAWIIA